MSNYQYESTWKVLNEFNFNPSELDCLELVCALCKKLIIEAKEAPCACKFCALCIEEYISNGNTMCPGNTNECKEEILVLGVTVNNHSVTNRKISKLKVKCPINNCSYEDMLSNMENHLILCKQQQPTVVVCPYSQMGCNTVCSNREGIEMTNHLQTESYKHAEIMMEMFGILRNEIECMRKEIETLKPHSNRQQVLIENLQSRVNKMEEMSAARQSDQSVDGSDDIEYETESDVESDEQSLDEIQNISDSEMGGYLDVESDTQSQISVARSGIFLSPNETVYKWNIREFSAIRKLKSYDSKPIYINPNKCLIRLRLLPVSRRILGFGISIYPNCIPGRYDNDLQWPIRCKITIGIINKRSGQFLMEDTKLIYYADSAKSPVPAFKFQLNERNHIENDCLTVKCIMKMVE